MQLQLEQSFASVKESYDREKKLYNNSSAIKNAQNKVSADFYVDKFYAANFQAMMEVREYMTSNLDAWIAQNMELDVCWINNIAEADKENARFVTSFNREDKRVANAKELISDSIEAVNGLGGVGESIDSLHEKVSCMFYYYLL